VEFAVSEDTSAIKRLHAIQVRVVPKGTIQMEVSSFGNKHFVIPGKFRLFCSVLNYECAISHTSLNPKNANYITVRIESIPASNF